MLLVALLKQAKPICKMQLKSVVHDLTVVLPQVVLLSLAIFLTLLTLWYKVHRQSPFVIVQQSACSTNPNVRQVDVLLRATENAGQY